MTHGEYAAPEQAFASVTGVTHIITLPPRNRPMLHIFRFLQPRLAVFAGRGCCFDLSCYLHPRFFKPISFMFVINIYLRFALIIGGILGGIALWAIFGFWYGFPFLLIGILLLAGYLMLGTILSTNQLLSKQQLAEAEARLKLTYFPNILLMGYKGVYYMTQGALYMQKKDYNTAEIWIKKSLSSGLPSDNERAAAMLQLVMIAAGKNNIKLAQNHFSELKKLNVTESMLKNQIKEVEKQLKQAGQAMSPSMMAMMGGKGFRPGSKRRQPPMR